MSIHEIPDAVLKVAALFLLCLGGYLQQCWPHLTQVGVWEGVKKSEKRSSAARRQGYRLQPFTR